MSFVAFDDVCVRYGKGTSEVRALEHVSLGFAEGDFVCIVGPSGCGKTTMLQTLAGFLPPSSGRVSLDGAAIEGPGADRGVVFQQPNLYPWMTVAKNAGFGPMLRRADARAEIDRLLEVTGLAAFRDRYPYELSGGMQQRLAIVRALANAPRVLLMDEPFGALDALTRELMQQELQDIWRARRMTVLFITHSVEEAVFLGTEVVVMSPRPGRIVERISLPFARAGGGRALRTTTDFIAARERILERILSG